MKMKVEAKILCLRKAASQIFGVCKNTFKAKNNYSKVYCIWFPMKKINFRFFYFLKFFLLIFLTALWVFTTVSR